MNRLITASLVGAVDWFARCPESWREQAEMDLKNQLGRIWIKKEDDSAMRLGMDFEAKVYQYANTDVDAGSEHFKWFVAKCKGGEFQKRLERFVTIDGNEYCLYTKMDVWFLDRILDIKTTSNYKGREKYLSSFQHPLYCYVAHVSRFEYVVAEFIGSPGAKKIFAHHCIEYEVTDFGALEQQVINKVKSIVSFLASHKELMDLYLTKFCKSY